MTDWMRRDDRWAFQDEAVQVLRRELNPEEPIALHLATGGGKTRVANAVIAGGRSWTGPVLWIAKDWRLLHQAATDLAAQRPSMMLARLGGEGTVLRHLPEDDADVVYTTVQTLLQRGLRWKRIALVVWDECHWGEHAEAGKILTTCRKRRVPVLGLTGTPRASSRYQVVYSMGFDALVRRGVLARPEVHRVETGFVWRPRFRDTFGDVTAASLDELGRATSRSTRIVEHYGSNARRYGKTFVFACNQEHAVRLGNRFAATGVDVRVMHAGQTHAENAEALEAFRCGAVDVLVSVQMLTHGVDVPDARTVFLCRPTASDILFAQMVGRGSRRHDASGKTSFHVVDFADNVPVHGEQLVQPCAFFQGAAPAVSAVLNRHAPPVVRRAHAFDVDGAPTWIPDDAEPQPIRGLWYRARQTFGLEIELTRPGLPPPAMDDAWYEMGAELLERLRRAVPGVRVADGPLAPADGAKDDANWNVVYDASAGWEVTSAILRDEAGFREAAAVMAALERAAPELGLGVNARTGLHVHLGWHAASVDVLRNAARMVRLFEPGLATLVGPSRIAQFADGRYDLRRPNPYCQPLATVLSAERLRAAHTLHDLARFLHAPDARYVTVNFGALFDKGTVEVRLHGGSLDAAKALLWVSLCQQLLWAAEYKTWVPDVPDAEVVQPEADIVSLARDWLPDARLPRQQVLLRRLHERRRQVIENAWRPVPELHAWVRRSEGWPAPG